MTKRVYFSIVVFIAWCLFATLFYKTLCVMLLCWLWRKDIAAWMPERMRSWGMRAVWGCLTVALWVGMPRYHHQPKRHGRAKDIPIGDFLPRLHGQLATRMELRPHY